MKQVASKFQEQLEKFDRSNLTAARLILSKPLEYPRGSGLRMWAELFMQRVQSRSVAA